MQSDRYKYISNNTYGRIRFNSKSNNKSNNHYEILGPSALMREAFAKEVRNDTSPQFGDSKPSQVTSHMQLSGHYTSWNIDCEGGNTL